jgi:hypothetical protein
MIRLAKQFEQSTQARTGNHYIPPRARFDEAEIERRRAQAGKQVLIVELEKAGLEHLALPFLRKIEEPNQRARVAQLIGGVIFHTIPYHTTPPNDPRMRHNHALTMVADESGWRQTPEGLDAVLAADLAEAIRLETQLADARREGVSTGNLPMKVGKAMSKAAIDLSIWPLSPVMTETRADNAQLMVREHAQNMQDTAIRLSESLGVNLSAAMLVDEYSPLSIHIQKTESDEVVQAYDEVLAAYKQAA